MKINKLIIKNIASIESAEIDFDHGPLADDRLFLICGDTGSGKSTILNAICLALYDQVPALETIGTVEEDREGLRTDNTRQLMRRGTVQAEVMLYYTGQDLKKYRARWEVHRARNRVTGALQHVSRELLCVTDGVAYTSVADIRQAVQQSVGLSFDQFTRTTMLAQGQFSAFMKAENSEKADILEKITGTEIYARLGREVNRNMALSRDAHNLLEAEIKAAKQLTDEEKAELQATIRSAEERGKAVDSEMKALGARIDWLKRRDELDKLLAQKVSALEQAEAAVASETNTVRRAIVTDWDESAPLRGLLNRIAEGLRVEDETGRRLKYLADNELPQICSGVACLRADLAMHTDELQKITARLEQHAEFEKVYENVQRIDEITRQIDRANKEGADHRIAAKRHEADAAKCREQEAPLSEAVERCTKDFEIRCAEYEVCSAEAARYNLDEVTELYKSAETAIGNLERKVEVVQAWRKAKAEWDEILLGMQLLDKDILKVRRLKEEKEACLPEAEKKLRDCETRRQAYAELSDHIALLRERFSATSTCPLCGTEGVHLHGDDVIDTALADAVKQADAARNEFEKLRASARADEAAISILLRDKASKKTAFDKACVVFYQAGDAVAALGGDYSSEDSLKGLQTLLEEARTRRNEVSQTLSAANEAYTKLSAARKELDTAREAKDAAEKQLERQRQTSKDLADAAAREATQAARCVELARELCDMMRPLLNERLAAALDATTARDLAERIGRGADEWRGLKEGRDALGVTINETKSALDATELSLGRLAEVFATPVELKDVRPAKVLDLQETIDRLLDNARDLKASLKAANEAVATDKKQFAEGLEQSRFTRERIMELEAISQDKIEEHRKSVAECDLAATKARTEWAVVDKQLKDHAAARPDMPEDVVLMQLEQQRVERDAELKKTIAVQSGAEERLRADAETARAVKDKAEELAKLRAARDNWATLDSVFGGAEGRKFRAIAQSYVLRALLCKANFYLRRLSNRYTLACDDGSLTINVIDANHGMSVRNVGLLSGGESFVVSLSLALGLSAISREKIDVDTLFIDEGFGTLDSDTLEVVLQTLDRLHNDGGHRIGIISHVQELRQRISTQIRLVSTGPSSSRIEVV